MTLPNLNRLIFRSLIGVATLPIVQSSAQAIVINDTAGVETARRLGTSFTAVTEIFLDGGLCSGSLINSSHVLTAQHCTFGLDPFDISVRFRDSDPLNTLIDEISVASVFEVDATNNLLDGTDIAILELSAPVPEFVTPLRFLTDTDSLVGSTVTTVGFGLNGVGSEGNQFTRDGRRWAVENILDSIGSAPLPDGTVIPGSANVFSFDFDDGTALNNTLSDFGSSPLPLTNEGNGSPGDSGGPLLVRHNDELLIAGVTSGGTTENGVFGTIGWWTGSEQHRSFIEQRGGQFVSTPESSSPLALITLGAVSASVVRIRRRLSNRVVF